MCSSPHWQVGLSWFREKLSPANREQRLSRWADLAKNCLPRIGSKELPRFREKYRALGRQKMGSNMRPRYIQFRDIRDRIISGLHCNQSAIHNCVHMGTFPSTTERHSGAGFWWDLAIMEPKPECVMVMDLVINIKLSGSVEILKDLLITSYVK